MATVSQGLKAEEARSSQQTVLNKGLRKNFQDSPSHQIFGHMHEALNKDKNKN